MNGRYEERLNKKRKNNNNEKKQKKNLSDGQIPAFKIICEPYLDERRIINVK